MTTPEGQAAAGWYPDPYELGRLRYFDGTEWTDHYHYEGRLPDIGSWLNSTFGVLGQHGMQAFGLAAGLSLIGSLIGWIGLKYALDDLAVVDEEFVNVDAGTFVVGLASVLAYLLWQGFAWLAINRFLQMAHLQVGASIADSMQRALSRLPKLVGVYFVLFAAAAVSLVVLTAVAVASSALAILLGLAFIVGLFWVFVKLSFLSASIAAAPAETPAIQASANVSKGRFWAVFGRLLLLIIGLTIASGIVNGIAGGLGSPIDQAELTDVLEVDGDEFVINDFVFSDLIPAAGDLVLYLIVSTIVGAITTVISTSGLMRLYLDSGGPSEI